MPRLLGAASGRTPTNFAREQNKFYCCWIVAEKFAAKKGEE
jgi:hypothetical protein